MVNWLTKTLFGVCGLLFLTIVLLSIRRKVDYLVRLQREVLAIAGGDLDLPLTLQGSDELTMLAECVDGMRASLMTRIRKEETRGEEGYDIVTALSHDLRTPLTSLSGYLEVLFRQDLPEMQHAYVAKCIQKAEQLKEISDLLFSGLSETSPPEALGMLPSDELMDRWIADYVGELKMKGFSVECAVISEHCNLFVQQAGFRRVLDNVFTNMEKYADARVPVKISIERNDKAFWLVIQNQFRHDAVMAGSGMGLAICENLMRKMGGMFEIDKTSDMFMYRLGWMVA